MIIVGAGLSGLIAAHAWPQATIVEAGPGPKANHAALLRFRSDAVAKMVGIEFHPVQVRKGIWYRGDFRTPDIRLANKYSAKVLEGQISDRSIWSLDTVTRWIAPENLYEQLVESVGHRITWDFQFPWDSSRKYFPIVSTAPLFGTLSAFLAEGDRPALERAPILVQRFRVPRAHVHQTVYFPSEEHSCYRASITGDLLIVEHAGNCEWGDWSREVFEAMAISGIQPLGEVEQSYGKIQPLPDSLRKNFLFRLTHEHGIYSLGRFATWRNILLDDVVDDIAVIKRLMKSETAYNVRLATT